MMQDTLRYPMGSSAPPHCKTYLSRIMTGLTCLLLMFPMISMATPDDWAWQFEEERMKLWMVDEIYSDAEVNHHQNTHNTSDAFASPQIPLADILNTDGTLNWTCQTCTV